MDGVDHSICGVADGRDRDFDLPRPLILTGRMFSNPRPVSMVVWGSSSGLLDLDAMRAAVFRCS